VKEPVIVQKVLRSLRTRYDPKISSLEERQDFSTLSMDKLYGILKSYEMRVEKDNLVLKKATFKASEKKKKKNKQNSKSDCSCNNDLEEDEEMENFIRKLKRGTDKYKGILRLKCFNCGGIGNFASKCPHKNKESDEEKDYKKKRKKKKSIRIKK
jgi:hypothetical protein